jgi:predicted nicotinamide N-methyase
VSPVSGYATKQERVAIAGVEDLLIRSLLDRQQYSDPDGAAASLGISSAAWPIFGVLWPSAVFLAARLAHREVSSTERILEIGCGLALASLVGHRRGADITASDRHPLTEAFLEENLRANNLPPLKYRHGDWGAAGPPVLELNPVAGVFDLIVGSDVLYERDAEGRLASFVARHAAQRAEVWIVDPNRGNRAAFNRRMAAEGFTVHSERIHRPAANDAPAYSGQMLTYRR